MTKPISRQFKWTDEAIAMLTSMWRKRNEITQAEMAERLNERFGANLTPSAICNKAAALCLSKFGRDGCIPPTQNAELRARYKIVRAFISDGINRGDAREDIIEAAAEKFKDAPRHRLRTIWRQEHEKRAFDERVALPPPEYLELQLAPGIFAADARSYELIQRAKQGRAA